MSQTVPQSASQTAEETTMRPVEAAGAQPVTSGVESGAAERVAAKATWPVQDAVHFMHSVEAVNSGATAHAVTSLTAFGNSVAHSAGGLLGVAAGTGVSAYINHLVFGQHEQSLLRRYRPQIASVMGKDEQATTVADLYAVADVNPSLREDIDRSRSLRNLRTGATLLASAVAFAAVFAAVSFFPPLAALGTAAATGGLFSGAGIGFVAASMGVSLAALHAVGKSTLKIGKKIMGLDKPTVEDHIHSVAERVEKGKSISPQQVMGVYVASSPLLQNSIVDEFGKRYENLNATEQERAMESFGHHLPLARIAERINSHELSPRELLFTVHGQSSGYQTELARKNQTSADAPISADTSSQQSLPEQHDATQQQPASSAAAQDAPSTQHPAATTEVAADTVTPVTSTAPTPDAGTPNPPVGEASHGEVSHREASQSAAQSGITASQWRHVVDKQRAASVPEQVSR